MQACAPPRRTGVRGQKQPLASTSFFFIHPPIQGIDSTREQQSPATWPSQTVCLIPPTQSPASSFLASPYPSSMDHANPAACSPRQSLRQAQRVLPQQPDSLQVPYYHLLAPRGSHRRICESFKSIHSRCLASIQKMTYYPGGHLDFCFLTHTFVEPVLTKDHSIPSDPRETASTTIPVTPFGVRTTIERRPSASMRLLQASTGS